MQFGREINRLLIGFLIAFTLIFFATAYWAVTGANSILLRNDNARRVIEERSILRGGIYDRHNDQLVVSLPQATGEIRRLYLRPSTYSAIGYYSTRYGVSGVEDAFNSILSGANIEEDFSTEITNQLLHRAGKGADIQLTLDINVQNQLADAMNGQEGAAVILSIPSGDVLAMISLPTYEPNVLDTRWDELVASEGNPFFNRVLQASYQPGAMLQTPLIAAALLTNQPIDEVIEGATQPYALNGLQLECAVRLPEIPLTLREAYAFACPSPFAQLTEHLGEEAIQATFDTFHFTDLPTLQGFTSLQPITTAIPEIQPLITGDYLENALGQGDQTVSPLSMAMIASAIVNDGNTPQPHILRAQRPIDTETWVNVENLRPTLPITTAGTARRLQDLMRSAVANGAAQNAGRPNIDIGGHAGLAYSGDGTLAWFIGFATLSGNQAVAVAVVLENSDDPGLAADIGGTALEAAGNAQRP